MKNRHPLRSVLRTLVLCPLRSVLSTLVLSIALLSSCSSPRASLSLSTHTAADTLTRALSLTSQDTLIITRYVSDTLRDTLRLVDSVRIVRHTATHHRDTLHRLQVVEYRDTLRTVPESSLSGKLTHRLDMLFSFIIGCLFIVFFISIGLVVLRFWRNRRL